MLSIASAIHGCALHPDRWQAVLGQILEYLDASGGMLWSQQTAPGSLDLRAPCGLPPESLAAYGHHQKDTWLQQCQVGEVWLAPRTALLRSSFYREFLRRHEYAHLLVAMLHRHSGPGSMVPTLHLSIMRRESGKPFAQSERKKLQDLLPHLQHATAVNFHLAARDHRLEVAQASVDLFNDALFFADRSGHIVYLNEAARKLLAQDDGLSLKSHRLAAAKSSENRALQDLLASAASGGHTQCTEDSAGSADAMLRITRPSGKQPYVAIRMQVAASPKPTDARRPHRVLLVHDPESNTPVRISAMRKRYALTTAETQIVEALLKMGSAKAAAQHLGLSDNTVKTHLRSIFNKTGAHRQSELIQLALSCPRL